MTYPMELARVAWMVFRMHLATIAGSRRTLAGIVLAAMPPLFGLLVTRFASSDATGDKVFLMIGLMLLIQFVVPMLSVSLGVGVIADEAEARTITYPFTRPIPRPGVFLGRWLATVVVILTLLIASAMGLYVIALSAPPAMPLEDALPLVQAAVVGGVVYSLGASVVGVLFKRGLVVALGYTFVIEILVANLPGSTRTLTVQYHLRSIFVDPTSEIAKELPSVMGKFLTPGEALSRMAIVLAVLVLFGSWRVARKQFVLSS
ncbi:MAG: ABC transporter permease subunit [Planctomycetota bacterium]